MRLRTAICWLLSCGALQGADLAVYPSAIQLTTVHDKATFIVQATSPTGITMDVTAAADVKFADPNVVRRDGATLYPSADGATQMTVIYAGKSVTIPIAVKQSAAD